MNGRHSFPRRNAIVFAFNNQCELYAPASRLDDFGDFHMRNVEQLDIIVNENKLRNVEGLIPDIFGNVHCVGMSDQKPLGARVRALRKAQDLTQVELSAATEIPRTTITGIERGTPTSRDKIERLAMFFNVPVGHLFGEQDAVTGTGQFGESSKNRRTIELIRVLEELSEDQQLRMLEFVKSISSNTR